MDGGGQEGRIAGSANSPSRALHPYCTAVESKLCPSATIGPNVHPNSRTKAWLLKAVHESNTSAIVYNAIRCACDPWMPWHTVCPRQKSLINCREGLRPCNARNQNHGLRSGYGRPIDLNRDLPPFHTRNVAVPWHFCLSTNVWLHDAVTEGYRKPHGKPRLG